MNGDGSPSAGRHALTPTGKNLDLSFIGKPHEHDPRRIYSTTATDWQGRVDFDRLRKDRLERARQQWEWHAHRDQWLARLAETGRAPLVADVTTRAD